MLKKKRFMKIISSILGISALCGFFACSMLDHSKKAASTNASANLSTLSNVNVKIDTNNYDLRDITSSMNAIVSTDTFTSSGWVVSSNDNFTFQSNYVYKLSLTVPSSILSSVGGFSIHGTLSSYSTNLDSSNGGNFIRNGNVFTKTFLVNTSYTTKGFVWANVNSSINFTGSVFASSSGRYYEDRRIIDSSLLSYYDSYLGDTIDGGIYTYKYYSRDFSVNFYYNAVFYNKFTFAVTKILSTQQNFYALGYYLRITFGVNQYWLVNYNPLSVIGYSYADSQYNIEFLNGTDINNGDLLAFINLFFSFVSYNTYQYGEMTAQQYQDIIDSLVEQNNDLQSTIQQQDDEILGLQSGLTNNYNDGYQSGYQDGYDSVNQTQIYNDGYAAGYQEGYDSDTVATTIVSGIFQVALVPINFFLGMFNFTVLGINFTSLIQAIFTIALTIIIVKVILGKKGE